MSQAEFAVLALVGYAVQWLRGFKWFRDSAMFLVALIAGAVTTLLDAQTLQWRPAIMETINHALTVLGGTTVAVAAAHSDSPVMLAPKFNQFEKPKGE